MQNKSLTRAQLIDMVNTMYRMAFEMGSNSYLILPSSKVTRTQLDFMRLNLLGAYGLLLTERRLEAEAAAKYPEMAAVVRSVIGYIPSDDPIQAAWTAAYNTRTTLFMQNWKNEVIIQAPAEFGQ